MYKIEVNGVKITLTEEQLNQIAKQTNKKKLTIEDLDFESASKLLKDNDIDADPKDIFTGKLLKLIILIKAVNFIDNNYEEWTPNFKNKNEYKHLPYFKEEGSGWSLYGVSGCTRHSGGLVGLYFKNQESGKYIVNKFIDTYKTTVLG